MPPAPPPAADFRGPDSRAPEARLTAPADPSRALGIAVVGCGAWGRNLVRTFDALPGSRLAAVVDVDEARLAKVRRQFPGARMTTALADALSDPAIEAVAIAAPAAVHRDLALECLAAGRHLFVEKPLALSTAHAEEIRAAAASAGRTLMVGHLLLHHPAVLHLKGLIDAGRLGRIHYMHSVRVNLGTVRSDENALWSLGPHDVSVMNFLLDAMPDSVSARGQAYLQKGVEDVVFLNLRYPGGRMGHVHLSWLDPHKARRLTIVGSERMAVFDDAEPSEKVRIHDKGAKVSHEYATYGEYLGLRTGDVTIPWIETTEPLQIEGAHFLECVRTGRAPRTGGDQGVAVVRVLEAAQESLRRDGEPVAVVPVVPPNSPESRP